MARSASALPGITHCTTAGLQSASTTDATGRLTVRAHEQHASTLAGQLTAELPSLPKQLESLLQVDDADPVAFAEDVFLHLRVPAPRLVAEVTSGLQQLLHGNFNCQRTSFGIRCLRPPAASSEHPLAGSLPAVNLPGGVKPTTRSRTGCLTLAELEALPRALLAVLLAFLHARIAR